MLREDRLEAFEEMLANIQGRYAEIQQILKIFIDEEKTNSVVYKKLSAENLYLQKALSSYALYGIIETDIDVPPLVETEAEAEAKKETEEQRIRKIRIEEFRDTPIEELKIGTRGIRALHLKRVRTIGALLSMSEGELLRTRNIGPLTLSEIHQEIDELLKDGIKYLENGK